MTLDEIAQFCCRKVGQSDANSVSICYGFVQARLRMIYDAFPWLDSQTTGTATVLAAQSTVALPAGIDRVLSVRAGGDHFLEPVDSNVLMQTNPTIFEQVGVPLYYEELTETAGNTKRIQVYPTPTVDTALFIIGKRTMPALVNATDTPVLRNVDNVLIAYTTGDMLERQRQYAKSQAKFQEAAALLASAQALENQQANKPRRIKHLTVTGNSLAEMTDAVSARTGKWDIESVVLIQEFLRRQYQSVYDATLWSESTVIASVISDGEQIVLPEYFDRVISVRADSKLGQVDAFDISFLFGINPQIFDRTGSAVGFSYLTPVGVSILPPQREQLYLVTTSATDKSNVFIKGESAGREVSENVVLNGLTQVQTVNSYDVPLTVAKNITAGDVSVIGVSSLLLMETIPAAERERKHMRLWLQPHPGVQQTCLILGKRRIRPLVQDEDTPLLRDIQGVLIAAASADVLSMEPKATARAADFRSQAQSALNTLIDLETQQGATQPIVTPYVEAEYCLVDSDTWFMQK